LTRLRRAVHLVGGERLRARGSLRFAEGLAALRGADRLVLHELATFVDVIRWLMVLVPIRHFSCLFQPGVSMTTSSTLGSRRQALKFGLAAAAVAAPVVASAQTSFNWKMTSAYPKGSPFYMDGPGSATDLARRIREMSSGRVAIFTIRNAPPQRIHTSMSKANTRLSSHDHGCRDGSAVFSAVVFADSGCCALSSKSGSCMGGVVGGPTALPGTTSARSDACAESTPKYLSK
jgi:hypothetical protein